MNLRKIVSKIVCVALGVSLAFAGVAVLGAEAQADSAKMGEALQIFNGVTDLRRGASADSVLSGVFGVALFGIAILAVSVVIWGGVQYMLSAGDAGKAKTAKSKIIYGMLGLAVVVLSYTIANFVATRARGLSLEEGTSESLEISLG